MANQDMDLGTQQRNAVRLLAAHATDLVAALQNSGAAQVPATESARESLLSALLSYQEVLPYGPQPYDRGAASDVGTPEGSPTQLQAIHDDILTAYERRGPMIDSDLQNFMTHDMGRAYLQQTVRGSRKDLCRMKLVFEVGKAKNTRNRPCSLWGLSRHLRKPIEPPKT